MGQTGAKKGLGLVMLTALVAGNMIGSGIFLLPASLGSFGSIGILAWIFTAIGAILLALVFAKLGQNMPRVGGPYAYCRDAYGDFIGFEVAYNYWIALWVGNAAIVTAFVSYLSVFFPSLAHNKWQAFILSVSTVWVLTWINILGVRNAGVVQVVTTVLKILPLLLLSTIGLLHIHPEYFNQFNISGHSNYYALTGAAALTLWSFIGVESATVPAADVINPRTNIPRATILGAVITAIIYILSSIAVMGLIPFSELGQSTAPYAEAAAKVFGETGHWLVACGAIVSCFGALNGWILLQGQVPMAASLDNLFPVSFRRRSRFGTPIVGLLVSAVLITGLLILTLNDNLVKQFTFIIRLATLATLFPYLLTTMGEIIIFIKHPEYFQGQRLFGSVIIAILAFLYSFWAVIGTGPEIVFYGTLLIFSGIPIYVWMKWQSNFKSPYTEDISPAPYM